MKNNLRTLASAILLFSVLALSAQTRDFTFSNTAQKEGLTIEQNTRSGLQMRHVLKQMSLVTVTDNGYTGEEIHAGTGIVLPATAGEPNLPSFSRFVAIPNGASAHVELGYHSMTTVHNVDVMAAAPIKFDTDDSPNTYERNQDIYSRNAFYPESPVTVSQPFSLRGVQTVAVTVVPFQYNPVTKELRVYDDLQFSVGFDGGNGEFGDTRLRSPYWDPILMQNLANYNQLPVIDYEARMQEWVNNRPEGCEYLIVIPNDEGFRPYANQLMEYRIKQGILTQVKSLSEMGCTSTVQMKSYFHNAYNTWDIPPVAVLLLADHNTNMSIGIPAETVSHPAEGSCITDNQYADVTGDNLPEMAFCRLVAANATEAQMMVSKQLEYEYTNPNLNPSTYNQPITALGWQTERWFQICSEVVGGYWRNQGKDPVRINAIYSGYPGNSWSSNGNTPIVVNYFGPNGQGYIPATPSELGGWTGGTAAQVVQAVNNGCMLLQHRDHGYYQGWGEPSFSTSHVNQMNNVGKMTFVNTINCQTGTFNYGQPCLVEAFMRRTYNGQNAGAVGCIGPTQTSYSFVNDTYVWGLYDQYDPQFLPDFGPYADYQGNWRPAFGNVAGKYFLQQSSWPTNPNNKAITHKMFTAHCDAFLTLYTQVPTAMAVNHPSQITSTTTSINVTAPAGAVIALTRDNNILAVAVATGSSQSISFAAQPSTSTISIVATKQDRLRYVGSIYVISEPALGMTQVTLNDASGNNQLEYDEEASFNITIKNTGDLASGNATATLTTSTPEFVTITQNTASVPAMSPNQTITLDNVFGIHVANNVPNETRLRFTINISDGSHQWSNDFNFNAYAPNLYVLDSYTVDDAGSVKGNGNGRLDPGEIAQITFQFTNNGGTAALDAIATLSTATEQYISIQQPAVTTPTVSSGQTVEVTYNVSVSDQMPRGEAAELNLEVNTGAYSGSKTFSHRVGLEIADFENGLEGFEWENDPEHPWTICNSNPYSGSYCLQSGDISHNQSSTLTLHFKVENETDEIRFFRKTDCENNDYLKFYIDGVSMQTWTGNMNWRECVFSVSQGEHTFSWVYEKNATGSNGADHVWIDDILFPVRHLDLTCNAGPNQETCNTYLDLEGTAIGQETIEWTTNGDGHFLEPNALSTRYEFGDNDKINKTVTLVLSVTGENAQTIHDEMLATFVEPTVIMQSSGVVCEGGIFELEATLIDVDSIVWETEGDGQFANPSDPQTTYTPGTQDIANGIVKLYMNDYSHCGQGKTEFMLDIHHGETLEQNVTTCADYFIFNDFVLYDEGDYSFLFVDQFGCDSTVILHLQFAETFSVDFDAEACNSFEWNGQTYFQSGIYHQTLSTIQGCDSIVMLHLTINPFEGDLAGDSEVDVRLTPSSTFNLNGYDQIDTFDWAIEPAEAGTLKDMQPNSATVNWSPDFKGMATLTVTVANANCMAENKLDINVKNSTGVEESGIEANIYPNPTDGMVNIEAQGLQRITVSNALGQIVHDAEVEGNKAQINLAQFGAGVYVIRIFTENGLGLKKVTLTR